MRWYRGAPMPPGQSVVLEGEVARRLIDLMSKKGMISLYVKKKKTPKRTYYYFNAIGVGDVVATDKKIRLYSFNRGKKRTAKIPESLFLVLNIDYEMTKK